MAVELKSDNILKMRYIRILRLLLSSVSAWPGDELGQKLHWLAKCYRLYLPFQSLAVMVGEVHYMVTNDLDFLVLGETVLTFLLTMLLLMRLTIPTFKGYRKVIQDFLMSFHLIHFQHRGIHFEKVHKIVNKVSHYFTLYTSVTLFFGSMLFNVSPTYVNYKNGAFSHEKHNMTHFKSAIYFSYPFFNPLEHFKAVTIYNIYCSYICGVSICIIDLLVILMAFHIIGHIQILRKNLENICGPKNIENLQDVNRKKYIATKQYNAYSENENKRISLMLKGCTDHHRVILRFTDKMSNFFGAMLAANYTFQLISCCILLLESTQGELTALIRFGPLTLIIFAQLIQISVVFEIVGTQSEKLPDALYSIPWECMDVSNQRSVCIILHRMQTPIRVSAMGMTDVGVTTMAGILKTTFSYFAFLRSINE